MLKRRDSHYERVSDKASRITHHIPTDIISRLFPFTHGDLISLKECHPKGFIKSSLSLSLSLTSI